jgi:hypothetical protein
MNHQQYKYKSSQNSLCENKFCKDDLYKTKLLSSEQHLINFYAF